MVNLFNVIWTQPSEFNALQTDMQFNALQTDMQAAPSCEGIIVVCW